MKRVFKTLIVLLALALLFSLSTAAFAADDAPGSAEAEAAGPADAPQESGEPAAAAEEPAPDGETDEDAPLLCAAGETLAADRGAVICAEGGVVYNNGATVYNNGGTVFNNLGVVYNNGGVCFNNSGTVFVNAGTVYNNAGDVVFNAGTLIDNAAEAEEDPAETEEEAESAEEEPAGEEVPAEEAVPVEEEAAPVEEEAAPVEEEAAPVEEVAPAEEEAEAESPVRLSAVAPLFEPLTAGYRRDALPVAAASVTNEGEQPVTIKAARVNGVNGLSFTVEYEKNLTVAPGETAENAWKVSPVPYLRAGEYKARLVLILESGETLELPFTLTVVKA